MAVQKSIELESGVTVSYHRIVSVNAITNVQSAIEVASYTSESKRAEEKDYLEAVKQRSETVKAVLAQHAAAVEEAVETGESVPAPELPEEVPPCSVFISTEYVAVEYGKSMGIAEAYSRIKSLPKYEGSEDLLEPEQIAEYADEAAAEAANVQMRAAAALAIAELPLTDEQAVEFSALFEDWSDSAHYEADDIRRYAGALYRCLQAHDAQGSWTPDAAPSLWKRIGEPDPSGVWPWVQPLGATDAYKVGDRVTHGGKVWVSAVDSNVWEPGVFGWEAEA